MEGPWLRTLALASHNNLAASSVATATTVADTIDAAGFPWVPAVVIVSAVAGVPAGVVVFTAVDVSGAPDVENSLLLPP
jgi:hypothetical protein